DLISDVLGYRETASSSYKDHFEAIVPERKSNLHCFGSYEFDYSDDGSKVRRVRFAYGMDHREVLKLLGSPENRIQSLRHNHFTLEGETNTSLDPDSDCTPPCDSTEDYPLTMSSCGNAGDYYFEVAYKTEKVTGYRVVYISGTHYGRSKIAAGHKFEFN
ncbi:MAG: hypothetical protein ACRD3W_19315, partial [Terriglobales bacterium]